MRRAADLARTVRCWPRSQQVLRLVVLLGPVVALVAAAAAGGAPAPWVVGVTVVLALVWASAPESVAGALVLVVVLGWWARVLDDALHPAVLLAAAAVVAAHVAALLAGSAPPRTPIDRAVVRLWVRRGAGVLLVAPVLWALARALRDQPAPGGLWPAALAAAVLTLVLLSTAFVRTEEG